MESSSAQGSGKGITIRHPAGQNVELTQQEFDAFWQYVQQNEKAILNGPQLLQTAYEKMQTLVPASQGR